MLPANPFGVISVDVNKIWLEENKDKKIVVKITNQFEVDQLSKVSQWLLINNNSELVWEEIIFETKVPEIISWDKDKLKSFFFWMKCKGFFWKGIAPRHIIINESERTIYILDFERPLENFDKPFSEEKLTSLMRGLVHEEFCAFLFKEEQDMIFGNIWLDPKPKSVPKSSITSKRQLALLEAFGGGLNEEFPVGQLVYIERVMSYAVTPFILNNEPFFPLLYLEELKSLENYVRTVLELSQTERIRWKNILEKRIKS